MIVIDKLCYRSRLRYVNASEKFLYTVVTLVICVAGRSPAAAAAAFAVNGILTVRKGGIPLSRYIKLLMVPLAFLILGSAAVIVNISKTPLDAFAFPVGDWYITGSRDSVTDGALLWAVALSAVSCLYFLSLNTTMTDILEVLRKLHVPALLIELMLLIYRFIFVLLETASAITTAQKSRLGNRDYRTKVRAFGSMCSALFIQAFRRANALYDAMESRCYDGGVRVLSEEQPVSRKEICYIAVFEIILLAVTIGSRVI